MSDKLKNLLQATLKEYAQKGFQKAEEFLKEMEELEEISTEIGYPEPEEDPDPLSYVYGE